MKIYKKYSFFITSLFIAPLLLSLAVSAEGKSIGKDQANIREQPSLTSAILFTAPLGYPIKIKKEKDNWAFFRDWQNNDGWVHRSMVSDISTAVVLVDRANIRSDASSGASVTTNANQGAIYQILDRKDNWLKLGYYITKEPVGWIRKDLVFGP